MKQKIEKALKAKGWEAISINHDPVSYGRDGREGGWYIEIDEESCSDEVYAKITALENGVFQDGDFLGCAIIGYNAKAVLSIIEKMPAFEPAKLIQQ